MKQFIRVGVLLCVLATAGIHLFLAITATLPMFYANAVGYLLLGAAYANIGIPVPRERVAIALQLYTALTIVLWLFFGAHTPIAYVDKGVELMIIGLLWYEQRID